MGVTSPDQVTWWYVDLGAVHSVYNIRIQFKDYGQMYGKQNAKSQIIYFSSLNIHVIIILEKKVFDIYTCI